jgi:hypothetical protein
LCIKSEPRDSWVIVSLQKSPIDVPKLDAALHEKGIRLLKALHVIAVSERAAFGFFLPSPIKAI